MGSMRLNDLNKLSEKLPNKVKYIVHCPTGPIGACEKHKNGLVNLYSVLGCHVHVEPHESNDPCINCVNELKKEGVQ